MDGWVVGKGWVRGEWVGVVGRVSGWLGDS